ncbi:hypothetical protein E2C01_027115 [Portunus trituberculatus]|uniref:Uncharacterized protein n=1 Tax=Portunus trituberculatus TaxID=210409 RepID=A0A5B7EMX2_PORTR|nr:hypothetical protein [Portunus trituberculatus]
MCPGVARTTTTITTYPIPSYPFPPFSLPSRQQDPRHACPSHHPLNETLLPAEWDYVNLFLCASPQRARLPIGSHRTPPPTHTHVTARLGVPPPGTTTVTTVPRRAAGEGAEVGGEEKAVSSNPGTRGAAEHDAVLFVQQRAGIEEQHAQARRRRGDLDSGNMYCIYAVLTHRTPTSHEGAPGLGKCRHPL